MIKQRTNRYGVSVIISAFMVLVLSVPFATATAAPSGPLSIDILNITHNSITLQYVQNQNNAWWSGCTAPAALVLLEKTTVPTSNTNLQFTQNTTDPNGTVYNRTITDLVPESNYNLYMTAQCNIGSGSEFGPFAFTTAPAPQPLTTSTLSGVAGDSKNNLTWTAVQNATEYTLFANGAEIVTLNATEYEHLGLQNDVTITYYVIAKNSTQTSEHSNDVALTPSAAVVPDLGATTLTIRDIKIISFVLCLAIIYIILKPFRWRGYA